MGEEGMGRGGRRGWGDEGGGDGEMREEGMGR